MQKSSSFLGRIILTLILMIGFYVLALAFVGFFIHGAYREFFISEDRDILGGLGFLVFALTILWSIFPRRARFEPSGPLLPKFDHPRLFSEIKSVAQATGQEMPLEVYLIPSVNAFVTEKDSIMGWGGIRVMGIGLPLLQVLTISQFKGVLAHEFGHFYGGDTKLSPFIYKTRESIRRTIKQLDDSIIQKPFEWYGKLFLLITRAVSRKQEFVSDAIAARIVGVQPMVDGFKRTYGVDQAFNRYWDEEVAPVLEARYRPEICTGFQQFLKSESVDKHFRDLTSRQMVNDASSRYDTHPSDNARIRALQRISNEVMPPLEEEKAITLLSDLPAVEKNFVDFMLGNIKLVEKLQFISWENVAEKIYLPDWRQHVDNYKSILSGFTLTDILIQAADINKFAALIREVREESVDSVQQAVTLLSDTLSVILVNNGGQVVTRPGEGFYISLQDTTFEPFDIVCQIVNGDISSEHWIKKFEQLGIAQLYI